MYNDTLSTPENYLQLTFIDGAPGPTIVCFSEGHRPPTATWSHGNSSSLPDGITQTTERFGDRREVELQWQRSLKFTDSGNYSCRVANNVGVGEAVLDLLVICK